MKKFLVLLVILMLAITVYAGGGDDEGPSFTGKWKTNWGTELIIELTQTGNNVQGQYNYTENGVAVSGRITGTFNRNTMTLSFRWAERLGGRTRGGRGKFIMNGDGTGFTGSWGNGNSDSNGGSWSGTRA